VGLLIKEKNQTCVPSFHLTYRILPDGSKVGRTGWGSAERYTGLPVSFVTSDGITDVLIL
jgi:hypothetical protein